MVSCETQKRCLGIRYLRQSSKLLRQSKTYGELLNDCVFVMGGKTKNNRGAYNITW
jgi:hypothetical protein